MTSFNTCMHNNEGKGEFYFFYLESFDHALTHRLVEPLGNLKT